MSHSSFYPMQQSSFLAKKKEAGVKEQEQCQAQESPSKLFTVSYMLEKLSRLKVLQNHHLKGNGKRTQAKVSKLAEVLSYTALIHLNIVSAPRICSLKHLPQGPFCEQAASTTRELDGARDAEHALNRSPIYSMPWNTFNPLFFLEMLLAPSSTISSFLRSWFTQRGFPLKS